MDLHLRILTKLWVRIIHMRHHAPCNEAVQKAIHVLRVRLRTVNANAILFEGPNSIFVAELLRARCGRNGCNSYLVALTQFLPGSRVLGIVVFLLLAIDVQALEEEEEDVDADANEYDEAPS